MNDRTGPVLTLTLAAALFVGAAACDEAPSVGDVRDRLPELESDLEAAEDLTADEARDAYGDLRRRVDELRADLESTSGDARGEVREVWDRALSALEELRARIERALDEVG
jgi:ElaB/YqjD/DUF883 family membrane-anchored ribosome-binding protein